MTVRLRMAAGRVVAAVAAIAGLAAACGAPARSPSDTVAGYFQWLGRDPIRTLAIVSPEFQRGHGLRLVRPREMERWLAGERLAPDAERPEASADSDALVRARIAWLVTQRTGAFRERAQRLAVREVAVEALGERARVSVQVEDGRSPAFVQHFHLSRGGPDGAWRIDAIEQEGVSARNRVAAFAAYPREATRLRLERSLRESEP